MFTRLESLAINLGIIKNFAPIYRSFTDTINSNC